LVVVRGVSYIAIIDKSRGMGPGLRRDDGPAKFFHHELSAHRYPVRPRRWFTMKEIIQWEK